MPTDMPTDTHAEPGPWCEGMPHLLWRAQQAAQRRLQESLEELGVTTTQLALAANIQDYGPLSAADLARALRLSPQSVTTAMNQLVEHGWLTRRPHPVHKRVVLFDLAPESAESLREGRLRAAELGDRMSRALAGDDTDAFLGQLRRIRDELEGDDPPVAPLWPERLDALNRRT